MNWLERIINYFQNEKPEVPEVVDPPDTDENTMREHDNKVEEPTKWWASIKFKF